MGIEPTALAWEARVLPLYDARFGAEVAILRRTGAGGNRGGRDKLAGCFCDGCGPMNLTINGDTRELVAPLTVAELLVQMALAGKRLAVERNGEIVPKGQHATTELADGDRLEIVVAVGGG